MSMNLYIQAVNKGRCVRGPKLMQTPTKVTYDILKLSTLEEQLQAYFDYYAERIKQTVYLSDEEYEAKHRKKHESWSGVGGYSRTYEQFCEDYPCPTCESKMQRNAEDIKHHKEYIQAFVDEWLPDSTVEFYDM